MATPATERKRAVPYTKNTSHNVWMRAWRKKAREQGLCVNSPNHGKSYKGNRCYTCWDKKVLSEKGRKR